MKHKTFIIFSTILMLSIFFIIYLINSTNINFKEVYINEVMADNQNTLSDYDNDFSDWIELYNPNDKDINLHGYYLTDNELDLTKWKFPKNSRISAKDYKIIFASGKNKIYSNSELHTNFKISSYGETLLLVAPDKNTIIDSVNICRLGVDASFGRADEDGDKWQIYSKSLVSPGKSNQNSTKVPIITFSHESGFYQEGFTLKLNSIEDSIIYYTLDGSEPNENSYIYKDSINIDENTSEKILSAEYSELINWYEPNDDVKSAKVVRAVAIKKGLKSEIVTKTYFVNREIKNDIPYISLSTNKEFLLDKDIGLFYSDKDKRNYYERGKAWERYGHIEFFNENNELAFSDEIAYRVHGGASRSAP